jgi:hypothetical protein
MRVVPCHAFCSTTSEVLIIVGQIRWTFVVILTIRSHYIGNLSLGLEMPAYLFVLKINGSAKSSLPQQEYKSMQFSSLFWLEVNRQQIHEAKVD